MMRFLFLVLFVCSMFLILSYLTQCTNGKVVITCKGAVQGTVFQSRNGRDYYAFTRVPYAKPPLGNLRFMEPQPAESWSGTLDATIPNSVCLQNLPIFNNNFIGQEDCLYLNVYTPKINASLPVMFYIHGGGWSSGNPGPSSMTRYFMDEDVVMVMPNYRLGALGFLSTENTLLPGNMGLKDMALALKWTKENIQSFGGDSEMITAVGFSTGAASVHYLCSVPKTRDLLKGCISQSGAGGSHFSLRKRGLGKQAAEVVANTVNCPLENLVPCLQSKKAEEITGAERYLKFWLGEPLVVFGPILEPKYSGALLTNWPVPDTNFPWLLGVCGSEGAAKSAFLLLNGNASDFKEFSEHQVEYLQRMLSLNSSKIKEANKIIERFFQNGIITGIQELYSEGYSLYPALKAAKEHRGVKYFYIFNYTSGPSMSEFRSHKRLNISGIGHGEDNKYYFDISHMYNPKEWPQQKDIDLSKQMIKLWVNFAKFQTPNGEGSQTEWQPFGNDSNYYLEIGNTGLMKKYKRVDEIINFWKQIQ